MSKKKTSKKIVGLLPIRGRPLKEIVVAGAPPQREKAAFISFNPSSISPKDLLFTFLSLFLGCFSSQDFRRGTPRFKITDSLLIHPYHNTLFSLQNCQRIPAADSPVSL